MGIIYQQVVSKLQVFTAHTSVKVFSSTEDMQLLIIVWLYLLPTTRGWYTINLFTPSTSPT